MFIGGSIRGVTPVPIGGDSPPVLFVHVGITREFAAQEELAAAIEAEREKIARAVALGAHAVCDVSLNSHGEAIHTALMEGLGVPFGVVSIYETYVRTSRSQVLPTAEEVVADVRRQILRGADLVTLHATVFRHDRGLLEASRRVIPTTSRGGALMLDLLEKCQYENPYYEFFDQILSMCAQYSVAVSLAPTYRPASVADAAEDDTLHLMELGRMSGLVKRARAAGVTIMIEGIGHAALSDIPRLISAARSLCPGAAYRVMPVSTDVAIGYDHISSAIAAAAAVQYGADSITCVTRKEHIGIPALQDTEEGVIAARIAAHSGYIARTGDMSRDIQMSKSRKREGCLGDPAAALFPAQVRRELSGQIGCTMCGEFCPLQKMNGKEP